MFTRRNAKRRSFLYRNSLSLCVFGFFLLFWALQAVTGWAEYNEKLLEKSAATVSFLAYLTTGNFVEVTFENWESEFFQMFLYVLLTVSLRQQGSSESKPLEGETECDRKPKSHATAPWPVRKGGWILKVYENSLSLAFLVLFMLSFTFHALGSFADYRLEERIDGQVPVNFAAYLMQTRFWFESFQNWQSEFLAIGSIVVLSIWLRQKGSPESKPVDMPHDEMA